MREKDRNLLLARTAEARRSWLRAQLSDAEAQPVQRPSQRFSCLFLCCVCSSTDGQTPPNIPEIPIRWLPTTLSRTSHAREAVDRQNA